MNGGVQALLRIGRNTTDLDRAIAFYCGALGFHVDDISSESPTWARRPAVNVAPARCARLVLGTQSIELTEFADAGPYPADSTASDLWFQHCAIVVSDMHAARARVMRHGATPITHHGPQRLPPSAGAVTAFKFRDPDGHPLELIYFPAGSGDPLWQSTGHQEEPSLGIDHSAISVADGDRSIGFYELLGLEVAARGMNRGREQQQLDGVADVEVEVEVVAMQAASRTPHLELLCYRTPRGRAAPPSSTTAIAADRLTWEARGIDALLAALSNAGWGDAVVDGGSGTGNALLRDPDGHLLFLATAEP